MGRRIMQRVHLGWHATPLELAARWLVQRFGADMDGVLLALPGARSGRRLRERLARAVGARLRPPSVVTAGVATDQLLAVSGVPARRVLRTLAWQSALRDLGQESLQRIVAERKWDSAEALVNRVFEEVVEFSGEETPQDDQTVVALIRKQSGS